MRGQCSICTELFEPEQNISAVPCGHTFHEGCVDQWLKQSLTCPQCRCRITRTKIINKLYFNQPDNNDEPADADKIQNDLDSARASLRVKDKEKKDLKEEKTKLENTIAELQENYKGMEEVYRTERVASHGLRRELQFLKKRETEAEYARQEAGELRTKLKALEHVEAIVKSNENEIQEIIKANGGSVQQLATWCTILKKELATKRQDAKTSREQVERLKRESSLKKRALLENAGELSAAKEQIKQSEADLKHSEAELAKYKVKVDKLTKALGSPSDSAVSLARRCMYESPAPCADGLPLKRPRLSLPDDFDASMELFDDEDSVSRSRDQNVNDMECDPPSETDSAAVGGPSTSVQMKEDCKEYGTHFIKITSAASCHPKPKDSSKDMQDISNMPRLNFNILRKQNGFSGVPSMVKKGYNGFGGHDKFVQPLPRAPVQNPTTTTTKKVSKFGPAKALKTSNPKLPTMGNFFS